MKHTIDVLLEIWEERQRQEEEYGATNDGLLDGTGPDVTWLAPYTSDSAVAVESALRAEYEATPGLPSWMQLVREEVAEAFQESDPARLEAELLQVAALCVSWVERLRARVLA